MKNDKDVESRDDVDVAKQTTARMDEEESRVQDERPAETFNISLTEADVHMVGDRLVLAQIVQLLSYIRHAVKNNMKGAITLRFGQEVANAEFNFDANGFQVPDLIPQDEVQIN